MVENCFMGEIHMNFSARRGNINTVYCPVNIFIATVKR